MYLIGVKIDYIKDNEVTKFHFTNDNIQSRCGCGSSFFTKMNHFFMPNDSKKLFFESF